MRKAVKSIAFMLLLLLGAASANAGVARVAVKGGVKVGKIGGKVVKSVAKTAYKVAI